MRFSSSQVSRFGTTVNRSPDVYLQMVFSKGTLTTADRNVVEIVIPEHKEFHVTKVDEIGSFVVKESIPIHR